MAKKIMKQANGMQSVMSPEKQWDIVKKFDGEHNPFGGRTRKDVEGELREMSLDSLQKYATKLEIIPTNNMKILKQKVLAAYDKYSRGLGRSPVQISNPLAVSGNKAVQKRLKENLSNFSF